MNKPYHNKPIRRSQFSEVARGIGSQASARGEQVQFQCTFAAERCSFMEAFATHHRPDSLRPHGGSLIAPIPADLPAARSDAAGRQFRSRLFIRVICIQFARIFWMRLWVRTS